MVGVPSLQQGKVLIQANSIWFTVLRRIQSAKVTETFGRKDSICGELTDPVRLSLSNFYEKCQGI